MEIVSWPSAKHVTLKSSSFACAENGRQMPVDTKPIAVITALGKTIRAFVPHWSNCPTADRFRNTQP
jgi:hypothetical protein